MINFIVSVIIILNFITSPSFVHTAKHNYAQRSGDCVVKFPIESDKNQPLLISNTSSSFKLIIPTEGRITVRSGEFINFLCSPAKNKLTISNKQLTSANCAHGSVFRIAGAQYEFDELQCSSPIKGEVAITKSACGKDQGKRINIGYKPSSDDWLQLIQICYDDDAGSSLYAEHIVNGDAINFASLQRFRPGFQTTGLSSGISANDYKQVNQITQFTTLLGSESLASEYINKKSYLVRGHLAPDADFLFAGLQFTTYFYINTCPQWDAINSGNWLSIEHTVRKVAERYHRPLRVITGSHGILTLLDVNNRLQNIYLSASKKLPVPKYIWKIIYSPSTKEGIAIVVINNPFIQRLTTDDFLCSDICSENGWFSKRWSNIKKGYAFCCDVRELKNIIPTIPKLSINGILKADTK